MDVVMLLLALFPFTYRQSEGRKGRQGISNDVSFSCRNQPFSSVSTYRGKDRTSRMLFSAERKAS